MEKLTKTFEHSNREKEIYETWESSKCFHADENSSEKPFSMVIPPPNITGSLHIGHALNNTLQDIIVRYKRMNGHNTLWMPGTDHAGIATQNVIERQLLKEGTDRHKIGRKAFLNRVWKWKESSGDTIITQLKRLGSSCDWDRIRFTMDDGLSSAVKTVFVSLYEEGLIYRDFYIINWCPRCLTALSDIEVEQAEKAGNLYYIKYPAKDGSFSLTVATTRPETMLGDTAVAVNPEDERFKSFIGKEISLPLTDRCIPIIADEYVEKDFGTGALKVTPAHDFNDFEIGRKHNLESINVFTKDGKVNENGGKFNGFKILKAREEVLLELKKQNLLEKTDDYKLIIGNCYRCKETIEPRLSKQWFVKVKSLAKPAIKAVKDKKTNIIPKSWENVYFDWMENIRDWCISRQLWWGHRIPAWYCLDCDHTMVSVDEPDKCPRCGSNHLEQDPDVLDTWFSSALWPFSTMGWPKKTKEVEKFYSTSLLITSFDIIFFWVARMMMMGLKFMDKVPFKDVYIHALVRDEFGKKMSKSKGNVVDPLEIMDEFGADSFRFTLAILTVQGRDISISPKRIVGYRNFINKLWNASKFILNGLDEEIANPSDINENDLKAPDKWIRVRLNKCIESVRFSLDNYKFNEAAQEIYEFVWHEFCDWYIEFSKKSFYAESGKEKKATHSNLLYVLDKTLRVMHPLTPFVTEEIFTKIKDKVGADDFLMRSEFPKPDSFNDEEAFNNVELIKKIIASIRNIRMENLIPPKKKIPVVINSKDEKKLSIINDNKDLIIVLAACESVLIKEKPSKLSAKAIVENVDITVPMEGVIDVSSEEKRLKKEIENTKKDIEFLDKRLNNKGFVKNASKELIEENKEKLSLANDTLIKLNDNLKKLKGN